MRRFVPACLLLSTLGCFEDLGPLPSDDDVGESTSEGTTTGTETGTEGEVSDSGSSESDASDATDSSESDSTGGSAIEGIYQPCGPNMTCEGGGTCNLHVNGWFVFNVCVPVNCSVTDICPAPDPMFGLASVCQDGECVIECVSNLDCGPGLVCADNQCYFNTFWGPCSLPASCPPNSLCADDGGIGSACLPECAQTSDCPPIMLPNVSALVCVDNKCEIPCTTEGDCPMPMQCYTDVCRYPGTMP